MINQAAEEFLGQSSQNLIKEQIQSVFPHLPMKLNHLSLQALVDEHFILTDTGVYSWEHSVLKTMNEDSVVEHVNSVDRRFPHQQYNLAKHKIVPVVLLIVLYLIVVSLR